MQIEYSDSDKTPIDDKQWFKIVERKQQQILFDQKTDYSFDNFKINIQNSDFHIIAPIVQEDYKKYKEMIFGSGKSKKDNIVFINDIIQAYDTEKEDNGLKVIKQIPKDKNIQVHIVYLGPSFIASYKNIQENKIKGQSLSQKEQENEIQKMNKFIEELTEESNKLYKTNLSPTIYTAKFINYDYQDVGKPQFEQQNIMHFPFFANDIIKLLYYLDQEGRKNNKLKINVKQYDLSIQYIKDLQQHLGYEL